MLNAPGVADITDLTVVPWGNAKAEPSGAVQCQHGANECIANTIESCAIAHSTSTKQWFDFLNCFESAYESSWRSLWGGAKKMEAAAAACASKGGIGDLSTCYNGDEGKKLQQAAHNATSSLNPPHQYTPWVTINDVPGDMEKWDDNTMLKKICDAYTGTKPSGCSKEYIDSLKVPPRRSIFRDLSVCRSSTV